MVRTLVGWLAFPLSVPFIVGAETFPMSLKQTVETALKQNPDVVMARLDEEKARQAVRVARDPFVPRVVVGSGLAYSNGFPMSIEGAAPSVVQANATQFLFNRPQSYLIAQARENVRGAQLGAEAKRQEVAYRTTSLYLDAERAARIGTLALKDAESLEQVLAAVQAQVREGRTLPLAEKQAALNVARARQTAENLESDQAAAETALAMALGFSAQDRVHPVEVERTLPPLPGAEADVIQSALASSSELRQMESQIAAKELEMRGEKAARLPRADLVAQYAMLARFNNYDEFFKHFQRNNVQLGAALQLPILPGPAVAAQMAQTTSDIEHLRVQLASTRNRIVSDVEQSFRDAQKTATAANVARLDLDVTREQLSVTLAQMEEGRAAMRQVEEARVAENEKWIAFYDAQYALEKARWDLLRLAGGLIAAVETVVSAPAGQRP
ncbi:MAG: TolC family protein [Acidobacteriia bacterium]|nr:TolC family protein [Terriglobia bacterium]MBV8905411.1 TolC family protein [Terriglobia bacterium]